MINVLVASHTWGVPRPSPHPLIINMSHVKYKQLTVGTNPVKIPPLKIGNRSKPSAIHLHAFMGVRTGGTGMDVGTGGTGAGSPQFTNLYVKYPFQLS